MRLTIAIFICLNFTQPAFSQSIVRDLDYLFGKVNGCVRLYMNGFIENPDVMVRLMGESFIEKDFKPSTERQRYFLRLTQKNNVKILDKDRKFVNILLYDPSNRCGFDPNRISNPKFKAITLKSVQQRAKLKEKLNRNELTYEDIKRMLMAENKEGEEFLQVMLEEYPNFLESTSFEKISNEMMKIMTDFTPKLEKVFYENYGYKG